YEGFVVPGPGAVLVETPPESGYLTAHVDPKAFFAPGRTEWTRQEKITTYGNQDTLSVPGAWINQHDYTAIVLLNPSPESEPLELSAIVTKDNPQRIVLVDPEGQPVVGAETQGMTFHPWDWEPALRASSIPLAGLTPGRARRITFVKPDRGLIGVLLARGD